MKKYFVLSLLLCVASEASAVGNTASAAQQNYERAKANDSNKIFNQAAALCLWIQEDRQNRTAIAEWNELKKEVEPGSFEIISIKKGWKVFSVDSKGSAALLSTIRSSYPKFNDDANKFAEALYVVFLDKTGAVDVSTNRAASLSPSKVSTFGRTGLIKQNTFLEEYYITSTDGTFITRGKSGIQLFLDKVDSAQVAERQAKRSAGNIVVHPTATGADAEGRITRAPLTTTKAKGPSKKKKKSKKTTSTTTDTPTTNSPGEPPKKNAAVNTGEDQQEKNVDPRAQTENTDTARGEAPASRDEIGGGAGATNMPASDGQDGESAGNDEMDTDVAGSENGDPFGDESSSSDDQDMFFSANDQLPPETNNADAPQEDKQTSDTPLNSLTLESNGAEEADPAPEMNTPASDDKNTDDTSSWFRKHWVPLTIAGSSAVAVGALVAIFAKTGHLKKWWNNMFGTSKESEVARALYCLKLARKENLIDQPSFEIQSAELRGQLDSVEHIETVNKMVQILETEDARE